MLLVQEYLLTHSLAELASHHGVYASFDKARTKFSLNYDMIEAKNDNALACQCRGLILAPLVPIPGSEPASKTTAIVGPTAILAYGFDRFFNFLAPTSTLDLSAYQIFEKVDGSVIFIYFDPFKNKWFCASRSVSEADQYLSGQKVTFTDLVNTALVQTIGKTFDQFSATLDKVLTYSCELTSLDNRVVVRYEKPAMTLLGARNKSTLKEIPLDSIICSLPKVKSYSFSSAEEMMAELDTWKAIEHEGVVLCDASIHPFRRLKIKTAAYVAAHQLASNGMSSDRNLIRIILMGQDDDALLYLDNSRIEKMNRFKDKLIDQAKIHDEFIKVRTPEMTKKEFAKLALSSDQKLFTGALFAMFEGKAESFIKYLESKKVDGQYTDSLVDTLLGLVE